MKKYKVLSLFAGIGGIDLGFKKVNVDSILANDIDKFCKITFSENFPNTEFILDDITNLKIEQLPDFDILAAGFPCQPFSVAGKRKGFNDDRGNLFFQVTKIISKLDKINKKPEVVFLENVKNLYTHDFGKTYKIIKEELKKLDYEVTEKILNTCEYGNIPQNRERLFIIAFSSKKAFNKFQWPEKIPLTNTINKLIDWNKEVPSQYYYSEKSKVFNLLKENVVKKNAIYQYRRVYVRENKSGLSPTLTANMGMGGHNIPIIKDNFERIRKLTPEECLLLQGFPKNYVIPENLSNSTIYKQIGNSVSVTVIERIAENIIKALN